MLQNVNLSDIFLKAMKINEEGKEQEATVLRPALVSINDGLSLNPPPRPPHPRK